jgi:bis(5'-nucleosyl)-tetraphosphatase (symmetrical)
MATYAVGDIHGCFEPLNYLLETISFNSEQDCLWLTGDLINRGPASLEVLRFIKSLKTTQIVLGNHDLHFLSVFYSKAKLNQQDTLNSILHAPDVEELAFWLRHRPLFHHDPGLGVTLLHAGLPPQWGLEKALECAHELEGVLKSEQCLDFFLHMKGDLPNQWDDKLKSWDRLRFIANCFTRLRFCDTQGNLDLASKGKVSKKGYMPWFKVPNRRSKNLKILFGHWASLEGETDDPTVVCLDTGCVWGECLTALRLDDWKKFSVRCS